MDKATFVERLAGVRRMSVDPYVESANWDALLDLVREAVTPLLPDHDRNYPAPAPPTFRAGDRVRLNELGRVARPRSAETWVRLGTVSVDSTKTRMVNVRWDGCASVAMVDRSHLDAIEETLYARQ